MNVELTFIPALLVILLAAVIGRLLSMKLRQPEILGEIILGMIIGNFVVLAPGAKTPISEVAEIGVLLLLFLIGLDLDLERFKEMVLPASGVAFGGIVLPFIFGYFAALFFGFSVLESLFIGASLVATSVGVSASILHESGKLRSKVGTLIMDSAVADDVIAIIIMTV
ncbi:MAG: cation:proton antiporter, partial [Hadesarchaea archaeon]|nr:cation:proton antiporter [Hadesarchaea archaeon]